MGTLERVRPWAKRRGGSLLDQAVLFLVNLAILVRHPIWMARVAYRLRRVPNIAFPVTFQEKRVWRLIFDRNPLFMAFGDKLATKAWMISEVPALLAAQTRWEGTNLTGLTDEVLANGVVIKANRGCDQNLFIKGVPKSRAELETTLQSWLKRSYFERNGRRYWTNLPQKIFAEEIIPSGSAILDFCFFCCDGEVLFSVVTAGEKTEEEAVAYFTPEGERIREIEQLTSYHRIWLPSDFALPAAYPLAVQCAAQLSRQVDFVRVDLMCAENRLYAGEMSPFPSVGAYMRTNLVQDAMAGWDLRKSWFVGTRQSGLAEWYRNHLATALRDAPRPGKVQIPLTETGRNR